MLHCHNISLYNVLSDCWLNNIKFARKFYIQYNINPQKIKKTVKVEILEYNGRNKIIKPGLRVKLMISLFFKSAA